MIRRFTLFTSLLAACGAVTLNAADAPPALDAPSIDAPIQPCASGRPVFLSRAGGTYTPGIDDSRTNRVSFASGPATIAAYNPSTWQSTRDCVARRLAPFDLTVTETDPGDVEHVEIVVSPGNASEVGLPSGVPAVSSSTCQAQPYGIAFVWPATFFANAIETCDVIVSQLGLVSGLEYVDACDEAMSADVTKPGCGGQFVDTPRSCGFGGPMPCLCGGDTQNSYVEMLDAYGACR